MSDQITINVVPDSFVTVTAEEGNENVYLNPITLNQGIINHSTTHISGGSDELLHNSLGGLNGGTSGQFYHLTSQEYSNLVTGQVIRPSDTGLFYASSNPSGFITGISDIVYTTGDQNIAGLKNFYTRPQVNGIGVLLSGEGGGGGSASGDYLPLSGGALTGDLTVSGSIESNEIITSPVYALSPDNNTISLERTVKSWNFPSTPLFNDFALAEVSEARGIFFSDDGYSMYLLDTPTNTLHQYSLSVAWSIETAALLHLALLNIVNVYPSGLYFSPDGLRVFITDDNNNSVHKFDLDTAWDISSMNYIPPDQTIVLTTLSGMSAVQNPHGIYFSPDGLKFFIANDGPVDDAWQVNLTIPWDLSSATSNVRFVPGVLNSPDGIFFNEDGTRMFIFNQSVYEFSLINPWDITQSNVQFLSQVYNSNYTILSIYYNENQNKSFYFDSLDIVVRPIDGIASQISVDNFYIRDNLTVNYINNINTDSVNSSLILANNIQADIIYSTIISSDSITSSAAIDAGSSSYYGWGFVRARMYSDTPTTIRFRNSTNSAFANISAQACALSGALTVAGNLAVDTNTLFVNASTDRVGIGTNSPTEKLTVLGNITGSGSVIINNDFESIDSTKGVILKAPNGSRFRITIDNSGALTTTAL